MDATTEAKPRAARDHFPELNHAEALHQLHVEKQPGWSATLAEYDAWSETNKRILADVHKEEGKVYHLLCRKCRGRGKFIAYLHRHKGECYQCKGSGWSSKGRRWLRDQQKEAAAK